jgi:hypothetical protein
MQPLPDAPRLTPSLTAADNDTGRTAFCGPYVLSAITGFPISKIEDVIRSERSQVRKTVIKGTGSDEVAAALAQFGYEMALKETHMSRPRKERPTLMAWMQRPRNVWAHYILAVHKGRQGHWILIKGVKMCDTYTEGRWTFVVDGPHRGARIMEVFEVRKALGV